jgi:hypothetical protein
VDQEERVLSNLKIELQTVPRRSRQEPIGGHHHEDASFRRSLTSAPESAITLEPYLATSLFATRVAKSFMSGVCFFPGTSDFDCSARFRELNETFAIPASSYTFKLKQCPRAGTKKRWPTNKPASAKSRTAYAANSAITSISTSAPSGNLATWMVERAGLWPSKPASYKGFTLGKSPMSWRNMVDFTTF